MDDLIASLELDILSVSKERKPVALEIGRPYYSEDDMCWYGPVSLKGIRDKTHLLGADDSFEAIVLCVQFVKRMLLNVKADGYRIVLKDTDEDYPIEELFELVPTN